MHYHENRFAASDAVGSRRLEDRRLLTGQGRFTANLLDSGALQPMMEDDGANGPPLAVCFVRSQPASGILNSLDIKGAQVIPGVHYVFTGADLDQLGLAAMPAVSAPEGASFFAPPERCPIASHRISFSGEIIACIVASTSQIATMAAEAVIAEIDDRDDPPWPGRNSGLHWAFEDHGECLAQAFAQADHCVELSQPSMRQIVFPMEPRAIIAWPWPGGIRLVSPSQGPVWLAQKLAEALGEQTQAVHVLTFDVGGAFGCRLPLYPEHVLMAALARHIQKPLAWVASRSESMLSDTQARDIAFQARMALDRHGLIQALAIKAEANFGAYASAYAAGCIADGTCKTLGQAYQIPAFSFASEGFFTAQTPVDAFRGAGKPESTLLIERLIDKAARLLDLDPVELRRRNVIPADALPKLSQTGFAMDKVDFADLLDQANALAIRYGGRNLPADHGSWLYGRGHALAIHFTGGAKFDQARIIALPDGRFELVCGLMSSGQGHETTFAQLAANELGVDPAAIRIIEGDSHRTSLASMTGGSNAMTVGAPAIMMATNALLDLMRTRAAREFEAGEDDIRYVKESQRFEVIGSDLALPMGRLVQLMHDEYGQDQIGTGLHEACCGEGISAGDHVTMPTLALFCDVRLDLETGAAQLIASYGAYDVGRVLNRTIVEGQLHGAIFQGYSWALGETVHYDEGGQLLTGSLMDYPLARADQAGPIHLVDGRSGQMMDGDHLAMKGVGELGTVAAPAALVNAIGAALGHHDWPLPACSETLLMAMKKRRDHG